MTALAGWENFHVIVGPSAGALIGLVFVVMTPIARTPVATPQTGSAFATPTIVHFAVVLMLSAVSSAPWPGIGGVEVLWGIAGLGGIVYAVIVARRPGSRTVYQPDFEDWSFHVLLPFAAYALLAASAHAARSHVREALFGVWSGGAAALHRDP